MREKKFKQTVILFILILLLGIYYSPPKITGNSQSGNKEKRIDVDRIEIQKNKVLLTGIRPNDSGIFQFENPDSIFLKSLIRYHKFILQKKQ